jgi:hypothetical protein
MRVVSIEVEVSAAMNDCYVNPALHKGANPAEHQLCFATNSAALSDRYFSTAC